MNCLVCDRVMDEFTPFCSYHAPAWGTNLKLNSLFITVGEISLSRVVKALVQRKKIVRWWLGSDVWILWAFPKGRGKLSILWKRLKYHLTKWFVTENWLTSECLKDEFIAIGGSKASVRYHIRGMLTEKFSKRQHEGINIAYYWPKVDSLFIRNTYGIDLMDKLAELYPQVNWIRLDGTIRMESLYPILDAYIRPSRHDGRPRLIIECQINDIPYYWSEDGNPSLEDMSSFVLHFFNP